jgi:hypothetical protein
MTVFNRLVILGLCALLTQQAHSKECWSVTNLAGQIADSDSKYAFARDSYKNRLVLCFNDDATGSVTGDATQFMKIGFSTLVGVAQNKGIELVETYQIDRALGRVFFTKSRIGSATVIPGRPDVVGAFVGAATKLPQ